MGGGSIIGSIAALVVLTGVAFAHPIGPALMLAAVTPFDAMAWSLFGTVGNAITYIPILIFLARVNPAYWGQAFLGTRIQQWAALFVVLLLVSHTVGIVEYGAYQMWDWLRKVTLFLLLGVFAWALRDSRYLALFAKVAAFSMTLFVVMSAMDFYLGIQLLPVKAGRMETAALETEFQTHLATNWRFAGAAFPVNRFANYLLLPIFLAVGWFMSSRSPLQRALAIGCTGVLVIAELLTVTRAGILGMVVGLALLLPLAFRFRVGQMVGLVLIGGAIGGALYYVLAATSGDQVLAQRFDAAHVMSSAGGRLERVMAALQIWSESPFIGVGWGAFRYYSWRYISGGGLGAHNGYMNVLAETGLLGFIPLVILTIVTARRYLVPVGRLSPEHEFWRPYFLCGMAGQVVSNVFNDYLWERYLWVSLAFVVALESLYHVERAKLARERLEQVRSVGERPVVEAGSAGGA